MMTIKINETGEIKTLEMLHAQSGVDSVTDFVGNNGGLQGQFVYDHDLCQYSTSAADYQWWAKVISDHQALAERIEMLARQYSTDRVMTALEGAYDCDLEDQAGSANRNLDEAFGVAANA